MTYLYKKLIQITFTLILGFQCTHAQQIATINYNDFKSITLNGQITLDGLISVAGNWPSLKNQLGQPIDEDCDERNPVLGFEPSCRFTYPDLVINYTDVGNGVELANATLTGSNAYLKYKGTKIRVGDSINKLQSLFPEAYSKRGSITDEGVTRYFVRLNVNGSTTYLTFQYNDSSNEIVKISLFRILS